MTTDGDRWHQIDRLFEAALDYPANEREAFVAAAAGSDQSLADAVRQLLRAERESDGRFDAPPEASALEFVKQLAGRDANLPDLGPYRLLRELGRGGMGTVYLATRHGEGYTQQVAVKLLRRGVDTDDVLRRFATERRILASLTHPNIARLIDGGATSDGRPYLVMEYVEGQPITAYADAKRLPVRDRLTLFLSVADAVRAAHAALVVHRDLKPSNILVTDEGRVALLDFGIAKLLEADPGDHTSAGLYVLTPDHASPEQLRGDPVTTATDVFQLGVLLYRLLTGRAPFEASARTPTELNELAARLDIPRPSTVVTAGSQAAATAATRATTAAQLRRALAGDLDRVIGKALHTDPARRYGSVEELARDISRFLEGRTVSARPDTLAYRTRTYLRRHPWVGPAAGVVLAFAAIYAWTLVQHTRALEAERNAARLEAERAQEVQQFLVDLFGSANPYDPADPEAGRRITVVDALDLGAARMESSLRDRPVIRTALLDSISTVYQALGAYDRALALRAETRELQMALTGPTSRPARDSRRNLALIESFLGNLDAAEAHHLARLAEARAADPVDPAEVANAHLLLGRAYLSTNRLDEAEAEFQATLSLGETAPSATNEVAEATRGLADLYLLQGRGTEAEDAARRAVALHEATDGPDSTAMAFAHGTLGQALNVAGKPDEAETHLLRAVELLSGRLGPDHSHVLATKGNLGVLWSNHGKLAEAEELFREQVARRERLRGRDHPSILSDLQNLGVVLMRERKLDEAGATYERVAAISRETLPASNYQRALPLVSLSSIHLDRGAPVAAERAATEAVDVLRTALPAGHFITAVAECRVGRALVAQGRTLEAAPWFERASPPLVATSNVPDYRIECLTAAADYHEATGNAAEAARLRAALEGSSGR